MMKEQYNLVLTEFYNTAYGILELGNIYIYKSSEEFGVGIENKYNTLIDESLANVHIKNFDFRIKSEMKNLLLLTSNLKTHKKEFASFCMHFIEEGQDGETRDKIIRNPLKWWNKWKDLIGNTISKIEPYDIIAELISLFNLSKVEDEVVWSGPSYSSIDIETKENYYEVKSSVVRFESEVTISSQYQLAKLNKNKKQYLLYFKFEKVTNGISINSIVSKLEKNDKIKIEDIEKQLEKKGFKKNSSIRNINYVLLGVRKYEVNDDFPKITNDSFVNGELPKNIKKINYTVSLEGIESKNMDW